MAKHELPRRDSAPHLCLRALANIGGAAPAHRLMKVRDWRGPASRFQSDVIERLKRSGLIFIVGDECTITPAGRSYLDIKIEEESGPALVVAAPRGAPSTKPLNLARHYPAGMIRPGSLDFRDIPSRMGNESVPYRTGRA